MTKDQRKAIRKAAIAVVLLGLGFYFIPIITLIWLVCGLIDVLRNKKKDQRLFSLYFTGNGMFTWLLSPFNLLIDLISYKNWGVWKLEQFPADYQREVNEVLNVFKERRNEIIADIDANFGTGRRGMYVYQWYGKHKIDNVPEFNKDFKYVKTIAVSVFSGREFDILAFRPAAPFAAGAVQSDPGECGNLRRMPGRQELLARQPDVYFRRHAAASLGQRV
ncbi:hypothetical protein MAUB1S_11189 [Mycolicibacterium aubagnense]